MINAKDFTKLFRSTLDVYDANVLTKQTFVVQLWLVTRPGARVEKADITKEVLEELSDMPWRNIIKSVTIATYYTDPKLYPKANTAISAVVDVQGVEGEAIGLSMPRANSAHLRHCIEKVAERLDLPMHKMSNRSLGFSISPTGDMDLIEEEGDVVSHPAMSEARIEQEVADFLSRIDDVLGSTYSPGGGDDDG